MSSILNRVRQTITSPTGTGGPLVLNSSAFSLAHTTILSAGGVDQAEYCYVIEEGTDFEIQRGIWTLSSNQLARNTPFISSISGTVGTTKMSLAGNATIRVIIEATELGAYRYSRQITGATDTITSADGGSYLQYSNATGVAVALAAPSGNNFRDGWNCALKNVGAGAVVVTVPGGTLINGDSAGTTLTLNQFEYAYLISRGTNYIAMVGRPAAWAPTIAVTSAQQLLAANNLLVPSAAGAQSLTSGQQLQAANNLLVPTGAGSQSLTAVQKNQAQINVGMPPILRSYLAGLLLSTAGSSTTFTVAAGVAVDSSNVDVISLAASLSKTTSTWSVGAAGGSLDAGSIAANTWYHVYIIKRPDTQVVDIAISLSATNPNNTSAFVPAAYTEYRRIGAMKTNGSSQWTSFLQLGDDFLWLVPVLNANGLTCSTTSANKSVEVPPGLSFPVQLISELVVTSSTTVALLIYAPDTGTQSTGTPAGNNQQFASGSVIAVAGSFTVRTNTSGQVGVVASANTGTYFFSTIGYTDRRGKDS